MGEMNFTTEQIRAALREFQLPSAQVVLEMCDEIDRLKATLSVAIRTMRYVTECGDRAYRAGTSDSHSLELGRIVGYTFDAMKLIGGSENAET